MGSYTPAKPGPEPTNRQRPPAGRVAPQAPPTEHQIRGEGPARREGGEEQQRRDAEVVEQLERDDLREDAQGREGRPGVRRWWGPPAWHFGGREGERERERGKGVCEGREGKGKGGQEEGVCYRGLICCGMVLLLC